MSLGRIKEVDLRDVWKHEQYDFSSWLAQDENLLLLSDTLGLNLIEAETEKNVGAYRCDILCKDEITNKIVLIENQLEPSNHDHLGKIITYASGLDASIIVWIVESAREEHASAVERLNNHTNGLISFFLIEVHAIKIGNSDIAPMFKVIEQPNDFSIQTKNIAKESDVSNATNSARFDFWTRFNERIKLTKVNINVRKATTNHWYDFAIGSSKCHIDASLINKDEIIRVEMWISDSKEQYDNFYNHKSEIENELGYALTWLRLDGKKASRIYMEIPGLNFNDDSNYDELIDKIIENVLLFKKAFKPYLI